MTLAIQARKLAVIGRWRELRHVATARLPMKRRAPSGPAHGRGLTILRPTKGMGRPLSSAGAHPLRAFGRASDGRPRGHAWPGPIIEFA